MNRKYIIFSIFLITLILLSVIFFNGQSKESFQSGTYENKCNKCSQNQNNCGCQKNIYTCPPCEKLICPPCKPCQPVCPQSNSDMSKYVLKSSIPPCPSIPDLSNYILKSEIPSCPKPIDMSKYVLKTSVPPPIQCPPCNCPPPPEVRVCKSLLKAKEKDCGLCPPCPRVKCPKPKLKCKQIYDEKNVNHFSNDNQKNSTNCSPYPYESNNIQSSFLNNN